MEFVLYYLLAIRYHKKYCGLLCLLLPIIVVCLITKKFIIVGKWAVSITDSSSLSQVVVIVVYRY